MATIAIENMDTEQLSTEDSYALAILKHLSADQVSQVKQWLQIDRPDVIDGATLKALVQFCAQKGLNLSAAGVSAFKQAHFLNDSDTNHGVVGAQTAGVYFQELCKLTKTNPAAPGVVKPVSALPAPAAPADWNQAIVEAAQSLLGMSTADGPDGGNNACAWSLNRVLRQAGIPELGENPNYVPSLVEALQNGRGRQVSKAEAQAGDLVVACGEAHIGVGLDDGCNTVLSNSSSKRRFQWQSDTDFDGYYDGPSTIYRLIC